MRGCDSIGGVRSRGDGLRRYGWERTLAAYLLCVIGLGAERLLAFRLGEYTCRAAS
jgi:hypothetical protein